MSRSWRVRSHSRKTRLPAGQSQETFRLNFASPSKEYLRVRRVTMGSPSCQKPIFLTSSACHCLWGSSGRPKPPSSNVPGRRISPDCPGMEHSQIPDRSTVLMVIYLEFLLLLSYPRTGCFSKDIYPILTLFECHILPVIPYTAVFRQSASVYFNMICQYFFEKQIQICKFLV